MNIIAYIDRNYQLIFNRRKCLKLNLDNKSIIKYYIIFETATRIKLRALGNNWYKQIN